MHSLSFGCWCRAAASGFSCLRQPVFSNVGRLDGEAEYEQYQNDTGERLQELPRIQENRMSEGAGRLTDGFSASAPIVTRAVMPIVEGAWSDPESATTVELIRPSNGSRISSIPSGFGASVDRVVVWARCAYVDAHWSEAHWSIKRKTLHVWADLVAPQRSIVDALGAENIGQPVREVFAGAAFSSSLICISPGHLSVTDGEESNVIH